MSSGLHPDLGYQGRNWAPDWSPIPGDPFLVDAHGLFRESASKLLQFKYTCDLDALEQLLDRMTTSTQALMSKPKRLEALVQCVQQACHAVVMCGPSLYERRKCLEMIEHLARSYEISLVVFDAAMEAGTAYSHLTHRDLGYFLASELKNEYYASRDPSLSSPCSPPSSFKPSKYSPGYVYLTHTDGLRSTYSINPLQFLELLFRDAFDWRPATTAKSGLLKRLEDHFGFSNVRVSFDYSDGPVVYWSWIKPCNVWALILEWIDHHMNFSDFQHLGDQVFEVLLDCMPVLDVAALIGAYTHNRAFSRKKLAKRLV